MNLVKEFKLFILPVFKGLPLIVTMMVLGYLAASYALQYMTPEYEVGAKIKLDNRAHGAKDFELFNKEKSDTKGSNFLTEVEVFKTKTLQRKALNKLDFDVSYYRVTEIRNIEMYKESPFLIDYLILDSSAYDQDIYLKYVGNGKFRFYHDSNHSSYSHSLKINKAYTDSTTISYRIRRNDKYLKKNPQSLQVGDAFFFRINNIGTLAKAIDNSNFFCSPVDKDVFIVKLHYKHEHPQKAVDFLNTLLDTYIETDGERKARKANKILQFIDMELDSLGDEMQVAGLRLSKYRKSNNIINADQETEAILRQLNQFDMSKLNLDLKEIELKNVYEFLKSDKDLSGFSPDFEMVKDDVFQHTFMDLKKLEIKKYETAEKYPESSTEIQTINAQVRELKQFIFKSIEKKLINIEQQRTEIAASINRIQGKFESYPDKERQLAQLERDFVLKEETYNYLNKKKLEMDIAHTADNSLHEVVDYAILPKKAASPNSSLIIGVVVFAALILSLVLIYSLNFFFRTVGSVYELKDKLDFPFIGSVKKQKGKEVNHEILLNLYSNVLNIGAFEGNKMITFSSISDNEGKTFITKELGNLLADYGKRVLLIDMNFKTNSSSESPWMEELLQFPENKQVRSFLNALKSIIGFIVGKIYWTRKLMWLFGSKSKSLQELVQTNKQSSNLDYVFLSGDNQDLTSTQLFSPSTSGFLKEMKNNYDVVLIDTENITKKVDAAAAMRVSDFNFFVFRKGVSKSRKLTECRQFVESYNLENIYLVFNGN